MRHRGSEDPSMSAGRRGIWQRGGDLEIVSKAPSRVRMKYTPFCVYNWAPTLAVVEVLQHNNLYYTWTILKMHQAQALIMVVINVLQQGNSAAWWLNTTWGGHQLECWHRKSIGTALHDGKSVELIESPITWLWCVCGNTVLTASGSGPLFAGIQKINTIIKLLFSNDLIIYIMLKWYKIIYYMKSTSKRVRIEWDGLLIM